MFLHQKQLEIEKQPVHGPGRVLIADEIDCLCLLYVAGKNPPLMTTSEQNGVLQRFQWARLFAATVANPFQRADGTETGRLPFPRWEFEPLMHWFLIEVWRLAESYAVTFPNPLPRRPEEPPPLFSVGEAG